MKKNKIFNSIDSLFSVIYYFAKLNLYFIFYTLRGGILLGLFPSFVSLCKIISIGDVKDTTISTRNEFKKNFKLFFYKANIVGAVLTFLFIVLIGNYLVLMSNQGGYSIYIVFSYLAILILYLSLIVWVFPLISSMEFSVKQYFKMALIVGITQFHYTFAVWVMILTTLYISLSFPAVLLFFTVSLLAFILVRFMNAMNHKIDSITMV